VDTQKPNEPPNPYAPPAAVEAVASPADSLRRIGTNYRYVILSLLAGILLWAVHNAVAVSLPPPVKLIVLALIWVVNVFSVIFAVRLALALHGVAIAVICGILIAGFTFLSGLVVLLILAVLSSSATKRLRAAGIKVGFLGPRLPS